MKHRSNARHQRGFTLVEIAIVLMIVGLLIGGILRGQELITSARVRNIIDQKSAIQTAYIGFLDRYRMLPGDLTPAQAAIVGNGVRASNWAPVGDGLINWFNESVLFFQNLTASGFISCGACMTVTSSAASVVGNSPVNVYGDILIAGHVDSRNNGSSWFDVAPAPGITQLRLYTGAQIPSQVLAEVDRKADDGLPGTGQFRFNPGNNPGEALIGTCTTGLSLANPGATWANPSQASCAATWQL